MNSKSRSLSGAALMLLIIPIFAGLLACIPVPIGDPEHSRIDPDLTGVWVVPANGGEFDESGFYVFEPYDKRTWLVTGAGLVEGSDADLSKYDLNTYDGFAELAAAEPVDEYHVSLNHIQVYKVWLKKLGGELFMTWEPKLLLEDGVPDPEVWLVYRIAKKDRDRFEMHYVDGESDLFDDVDETRRAYERVIRKNADNPELYLQSGSDPESDKITLVRAGESELEFVEKLLETIVSWD
jgi:hypothetical protein